jgi:SAM-dependent methyltransferase
MNDVNSAHASVHGADREDLRYQAFCADRLVPRLDLAPGNKVLDACAGTGVLSLALAQAVGPTGRVAAVDSSEPLLAQLEAKIRQFGIGNIDVHAMPEARLDFRRDYFHAVTCSLARRSPRDMQAAVQEWRRVLQPGGRVLWSVLAHGAFEPYASELRATLTAFGVAPPDLPWMTPAGPETVAEILRAAGFEEIAVETVALGYHLPDAMAWWQVVSFGPLRDWLQPLSESQRHALRAKHLTDIGRSLTADGLWLDVPVWMARGIKPAS